MRPSGRYLTFGVKRIMPIGLALAPLLLLVQPALVFERPAPPQVLFADLYADVELERVFPDGKEFADATAKSPPAEILALYHAQKPNSLEGLRRFVVTHFDLPAEAATPLAASEHIPIRRHIDTLWTLLSWLGSPPALNTALLTALRNWLMMNTVSNGRRLSASRLDPRMSTNMMTT
jgi:hypothetical protein